MSELTRQCSNSAISFCSALSKSCGKTCIPFACITAIFAYAQNILRLFAVSTSTTISATLCRYAFSMPGRSFAMKRRGGNVIASIHSLVLNYSVGTLYLLMRWVEGTDLRTLLRGSDRLSPARAVRLLRPVASALAAAHRRGLVHRDIKPANVLIAGGEEEHVYLTDFGIARRTEGEAAMTRTGVFVGTVDYSAPERLEGSRGDASRYR